MEDNWEQIRATTVFAQGTHESHDDKTSLETSPPAGHYAQNDSLQKTSFQDARLPSIPSWPFAESVAQERQAKLGEWQRTVTITPGVTLSIVRIPAGRFVMGSREGAPDESPPCVVEIAQDFWISACEITNQQFAAFDPTHDSHVEALHGDQFGYRGFSLNEPEQPVVRVTWCQALAFCEWLFRRHGERFRLPTEAESEYACRAGTESPFWYGTADTDFSRYTNLADAKFREFVLDTFIRVRTIPNPNPFDDWIPKDVRWNDDGLVSVALGSYQPSPWHLHDMHSNVWEWTLSPYKPYLYDDNDGRTDVAPPGCRVVRGGSWYDRPKRTTSSFCLAYPPYSRVFNVGFRTVAEDLD